MNTCEVFHGVVLLLFFSFPLLMVFLFDQMGVVDQRMSLCSSSSFSRSMLDFYIFIPLINNCVERQEIYKVFNIQNRQVNQKVKIKGNSILDKCIYSIICNCGADKLIQNNWVRLLNHYLYNLRTTWLLHVIPWH